MNLLFENILSPQIRRKECLILFNLMEEQNVPFWEQQGIDNASAY